MPTSEDDLTTAHAHEYLDWLRTGLERQDTAGQVLVDAIGVRLTNPAELRKLTNNLLRTQRRTEIPDGVYMVLERLESPDRADVGRTMRLLGQSYWRRPPAAGDDA